MAPMKAKTKKVTTARTARARHRPHLIDACIAALHLYGPSKTTVDKVVAIAGLSPGIVRFYFDSKDAMLVASLEFLASEFEQQLIVPVSAHISEPIAALNLLVDLYLGAELASTRKVSVWYSFWGEASSRQEYYDICGSRDAKFEALVYELTRRLLDHEPASPAEPDAIALGLIGTLEMLWQGFAFQTEAAIDRGAARHRMDSYLRSVFPASFGRRTASTLGLPLGDLGWHFAGRVTDLAVPGATAVVETPSDRMLVVRGSDLVLRAFANRCPIRPHALIEGPRGRPIDTLHCRTHAIAYDLNGRNLGAGVAALQPHLCITTGSLIWVSASADSPPPSATIAARVDTLTLGAPHIEDVVVEADWSVLVDLWRGHAPPTETAASWSTPGWSADRFRHLTEGAHAGLSIWLEPNQLVDIGPAGLTVTAVQPIRSGRARVRQWRYDRVDNPKQSAVLRYLLNRQFRSNLAIAASTQRGLDAQALRQNYTARNAS